jgi:serine/threonine protein kinase
MAGPNFITVSNYFMVPSAYALGGEIGRGQFGRVFAAIRAERPRKLAVKVIPIDERPLPGDQQHDSQVLMRELQILAAMKHPATLSLVGFRLPAPPDNELIVVTRRMPHTLSKALEGKVPNFTPTKKSIAVFGIAAAMDYLHLQGIMHRDLKPDNVFLDKRLEPVVGDFGTARSVNRSKEGVMTMTGTPLYMAPECVSEEMYDNKVDVYSYAVLLYRFFSSSESLDDGTRATNYRKFLTKIADGARLGRQPEIPEFYWQLITSCWSQAPSARPTFSAIVGRLRNSRDLYALPKTDIAQLVEYENRILGLGGASRHVDSVIEQVRRAAGGDLVFQTDLRRKPEPAPFARDDDE